MPTFHTPLKNIFHHCVPGGFAVGGLLALLSACSNIDEADRLIYVEPIVPIDIPNSDVEADSLYDAPVAIVPRRVLIEDHTGQVCPNCPDAGYVVHQFQQTYGDLIVPVAIHSEMQGIMEPAGLANELGNTYYKYWNMEYKPAGLISRIDGDDGKVLDKTWWTAALQYILPQETPLDIRIRATQANNSQADIDVKVLCTRPEATVSGKLQVWVTEDNIVALQDSMGIRIDNYVHNHVLRAAVNGTWGQDISLTGAEGGNQNEQHYSLSLNPAWKPSDVVIVAFVYNDDEVVQAAKAKLNIKE